MEQNSLSQTGVVHAHQYRHPSQPYDFFQLLTPHFSTPYPNCEQIRNGFICLALAQAVTAGADNKVDGQDTVRRIIIAILIDEMDRHAATFGTPMLA